MWAVTRGASGQGLVTTQRAYELAKEAGAFGFLDAHNLPRLKQGEQGRFIAHCQDELGRSREPFRFWKCG